LEAGPECLTLMEDWSEAVEGGSYVSRVMGDVVLGLADKDAIDKVLKSRPNTFRKNAANWRKDPGLFMAEGDDWRLQRRATLPFFGEQQTTRMVGAFAKTARSVEKAIMDSLGSVGISKLLNQATLEVLFATTMSTRLSLVGNAAADADNPLLSSIETLMASIAHVTSSPVETSVATLLCDIGLRWLATAIFPRFRAVAHAFDKMDGLGERMVLDRAAAKERGDSPTAGAQKGDLLDSIYNLRRESWGGIMTVMLVAGAETTAVSTAWTLSELARYPEAQKRAREEVLGFFKGSGEAERALGPQEFSLGKLCFLEACILEALRLHAVADGPINTHKSLKPFELLGRSFPAGTVVVPLFKPAMKRDMKTRFGWEDLEEFNPKRWMAPDGSIDRDKEEAILSFGGGPRKCPGAQMAKKQMAVVLCTLLSRFGSIRFDEALSGPGGSLVKQEMRTTICPKNLHLLFEEPVYQ